MKRIFSCFLILAFAALQINCERDDICGGTTPTTPRVVIKFYDYNNTSLEKPVTLLSALAMGSDSIKRFNAIDSIMLPLKTDAISTTYTLTLNDDDNPATPTFTDELKFNYTTREEYVSRACGYKTVFQLSDENGIPAIILNNGGAAEWIRNIVIDTRTIAFENETHIRIYF